MSRSRDLQGRNVEPWFRRAWMLVFFAFAILALANVFGQRPVHHSAVGPAGKLEISAPKHLRGGLLYQARFTITAARTIQSPHLVLSTGWLENMTVNTIEPQASEELNRNGRLVLSYDTLDAGQKLDVFIQYQANPTAVGTRTQTAELDDAETPIATITRKLTVFP
jgi:hypothetical protein